jgi:hypothetical protein
MSGSLLLVEGQYILTFSKFPDVNDPSVLRRRFAVGAMSDVIAKC